MKKSSPRRANIFLPPKNRISRLYIPLCALCLCFSLPSFSRPFDWHYNYLSTPFAIFYNPSLLGNNAGYTFGFDGRFVDDLNYDGQLSLVVPVSKVAVTEDRAIDRGGPLRYANTSHRSSQHAVSVGGTFNSEEDYKVTAGFTAPVHYLQTGGSVDYAHKGGEDSPKVSINAALSANVFERIFYLTLHNLWASERYSENLFGVSVGGAAVLFSNPYAVLIPVEAIASTYFENGEVSRLEGTARLTLDLTPILTGREKIGRTAILSGGYTYTRYADGTRDKKYFGNLGIVFMGRSSSAAAFGSRGLAEAYYGAFIYNSFRESSASIFADSKLKAGLKYSETRDGQILFHLQCSGNNTDSWVLRIDTRENENVKTFSGGNTIPATIQWDKTNSLGEPMKDQPVRAKLIVKSKKDTVVESEWVLIE
jgi:hypothetical protein